MEIVSIYKMRRTSTSQISALPPWEAINKYVIIPDTEHRINCQLEFQAYIDEHYKQFNKIYTDGSKINEPVPSVASAIYIPHIIRTTC